MKTLNLMVDCDGRTNNVVLKELLLNLLLRMCISSIINKFELKYVQ